jgi:hypothetical protein
MAKDPIDLAGFDVENTGGLLSGFLAEEDEFDRRSLWRLGSWGVAAVTAVIVALMANQSSIGSRRDQVAAADLARQSQQIQTVAKDSQNEARRLTSAIDTLNGDRDRLFAPHGSGAWARFRDRHDRATRPRRRTARGRSNGQSGSFSHRDNFFSCRATSCNAFSLDAAVYDADFCDARVCAGSGGAVTAGAKSALASTLAPGHVSGRDDTGDNSRKNAHERGCRRPWPGDGRVRYTDSSNSVRRLHGVRCLPDYRAHRFANHRAAQHAKSAESNNGPP